MITAHKFTNLQIEAIAKALNVANETVIRLEEDENLEIVAEGKEKPLLIYVSADAETNVVTIDVFVDDNTLDNEEAYLCSVDTAENLTIDEAIASATEKFMRGYGKHS